MKILLPVLPLTVLLALSIGTRPDAQAAAAETIELLAADDLDDWYVYTVETKYQNPGVFQLRDGKLFVPGGKGDTGYFGGLITKKAYSDYQLEFEYKWGEPTYGTRKDKARDAGVLFHCVGPNGPGPWMTSYEFQIIEGGTGDLLVVNRGPDDQGNPITLAGEATAARRGGQYYYDPEGETQRFDSGRLNWWGRDPEWKDEVGFRGARDVESPFGEWTECKLIARGDTAEFFVNGELVNRVTNLNQTEGKILLQTEGAEIWYRDVKLTPLEI